MHQSQEPAVTPIGVSGIPEWRSQEMELEDRSGPGHDPVDAGRREGLIQADPKIVAGLIEPGHGLAIEELQRLESRRHGRRVAVVGARMDDGTGPSRIVGRHDIGAAAEGADGQTAADDLAEGGQVGTDAVAFLDSAEAEPEGDDLVEHQQHPALGGDGPKASRNAGSAGMAPPAPIIGSTMTAAN